MEEAEEAARRIVNGRHSYHDGFIVARAYLSSRPFIIEECAKVVDQQAARHTGQMRIAIDYAARRIRSLKEEKDGQ